MPDRAEAQAKAAAKAPLGELEEIDRGIAGRDAAIALARAGRAEQIRRLRNVERRIATASGNGRLPPASGKGGRR